MRARVYFESLGRRDASLGRLSIRRTLAWPEWAWHAYKRGFFWQHAIHGDPS